MADKTKTEQQFNAALRHWDQGNPATLEWAGARTTRRTAFALMWFIENVTDDAPGRTDVFFRVREMYRQSGAGTPLLAKASGAVSAAA